MLKAVVSRGEIRPLGDDAKPYQVKQVRRAIEVVQERNRATGTTSGSSGATKTKPTSASARTSSREFTGMIPRKCTPICVKW